MSAWSDHVEKWKDCQACPLAKQRFRICIARGTVPADVLFIGQAPGASEDARGLPFDGPAGDLLNKIIDRALANWQVPGTEGPAYNSVTYALTNLVCCFPREAKMEGSEEPHPSEIAACRPRLTEFVNIVRPKLIVYVGALSAEYVDHGDTVRCVDIIHPAAILRRDMPLAQKNMAVQKVIVILRNAVEDMLQVGNVRFTKWGERHADVTSKDRLRSDYAAATSNPDSDIPF